MKKSLKPFSFKTILTKDAYSSFRNTVFGVIASKLATVCRKMVFLSDNISGRQDNCQHFHLCCGNICRGFIVIWILRKKQDVGQWRIGLNNLKIVVRIWNVTVGGIVCSSRISHRRRQSPVKDFHFLTHLIFFQPVWHFMLSAMTMGHPQTRDQQLLESIVCA